MIVVGLMSGTSFDAIDAAVAELIMDGDRLLLRPLGMISRPYPDDLRAEITGVLPPGRASAETICRLDTRIGQVFGALARQAIGELSDGRAELVASHGQTIFHWTEGSDVLGTLQLGQPAWIAAATGLPVVSDFRPADIAAGGQGAPLVSAFDVLWLRGRPGRPVALNLGGIANVTVAGDGGQAPIAFDVGPANALIDAAVTQLGGGETFDRDGERAARGRVRDDLLERLRDHPYFARPAPKSTGKELFNLDYLERAVAGLPAVAADDLIATVTELTAVTVAEDCTDQGASEVVAAGGGTRNPVLMSRLQARLGDIALRRSDELGVPAGGKEAYAFAVLGFLTAHGLPGNVPSCTGADRPVVLGSLTPGPAGLPAAVVTGAVPGAVVAPDRLIIV